MSNLREINELLHRFFEEYLKWILLSLLFPAFGFKTIPEAFKIIVLPAPTTVCRTIYRLPLGMRKIENPCLLKMHPHALSHLAKP